LATGATYTQEQISRAIYLLRTETDNPNRSLYENNRAVYGLLRYGEQFKTAAGHYQKTGSFDFSTQEGTQERTRRTLLVFWAAALTFPALSPGRASALSRD
jgi:hypothetical protein